MTIKENTIRVGAAQVAVKEGRRAALEAVRAARAVVEPRVGEDVMAATKLLVDHYEDALRELAKR